MPDKVSNNQIGETMKALSLLMILSLISCATRAPVTYKQQCAHKGMMLKGVSSSEGTGSGYNFNTGVTSTSYSGENVSCEVPKTKVEKCVVSEIQKSLGPVQEYNEWAETKRLVSGLGYWAFILPGVAAKLAFDGQRDTAVKKSRELEVAGESSCEKEAEEREPASN